MKIIEEDEEVIDAERNFQNVAGDELQRDLVSLPEIENDRERSGQHNVHRAPAQRSAKADNAAGTMKTRRSSSSMPSAKTLKRIQK